MQSDREGGGAVLHLLIVILVVVVVACGLAAYLTRSASSATRLVEPVRTANAFTGGKYEASGVTQVPGTNGFLFVDDARPGEVMWMELDNDGRQKGSIKAIELGVKIEDPEGITSDGSHVYVVGSQSTKRGVDVEGIARFEFNRDTLGVAQVQTVSKLKRFLTENVAELRNMASIKAKADGINIEGLAWDPIHGYLLLGLRSPLVDGKALLVPLKLRDPKGPFSSDNLETKGLEAIKLPLGGLGIRGIEYDNRQRLFLIIAGATKSRGKVDFHLWEWNGQTDSSGLREVATFDRKLQPEGIAPASIDGSNFKLVVFDTSKYLKME